MYDPKPMEVFAIEDALRALQELQNAAQNLDATTRYDVGGVMGQLEHECEARGFIYDYDQGRSTPASEHALG